MQMHQPLCTFCLQHYVIKLAQRGKSKKPKGKKGKLKRKKKLKEPDLNIQRCIALMEYASLQYSAKPFRDLPLSLGKLNLPNVPSV